MFKPEIEGVVIYLKDRETGAVSKEVDIKEIIYGQNYVEFEFDDGGTLPYKDFLWFAEDYETIVKVKGTTYGETERGGLKDNGL